jgi:hypothetical protein
MMNYINLLLRRGPKLVVRRSFFSQTYLQQVKKAKNEASSLTERTDSGSGQIQTTFAEKGADMTLNKD